MNTRLILSPVFTLALVLSLLTSGLAGDWSQWRGPNRDAKSHETGLLEQWPEDGPPLAWKMSGMGGGYSSIAVDRGRLYTLGDLDDGCYVISLDEGSGEWSGRRSLARRAATAGIPGHAVHQRSMAARCSP